MELDDLIQQVEASAISEEPLDLIAAAIGAKADLDDLGDGLIDVFVDRARKAGCSWSEIGSVMGVTKQAVQQRQRHDRHGRVERRGRMPIFTRFTQRARNAVREADSAATSLRHDAMGPEHLLLGILAVPRSLAAESLASMGITSELVISKLDAGAVQGDRGRRRRVPFTAQSKQVLELSLGEALKMAHNYVGTEHLLLSLLTVKDTVAATILTDAGVTYDRVRADVAERLQAAS